MQCVPPLFARKERVAAFTSARIDKILSLSPDLVLAFSDLQAEIAAELITNGVAVMTYNQRDISGILAMIRHLGSTVGVADKAEALALSYEKRLADLRLRKKPIIDHECILRNGTTNDYWDQVGLGAGRNCRWNRCLRIALVE